MLVLPNEPWSDLVARWRRLDGAHLLTLVRAGIAFIDGVQPEGKASKVKARAA